MQDLETLKSVELFSGLEADELQKIAALLEERNYAPDEIIVKQGSPRDKLYIITEGLVEVSVEKPSGDGQHSVVKLGKGQTVGEMSLVDQGSRSATVRAISDPTKVLAVNQQVFSELCNQDARIGYIVMKNIAADLSFRLRQRHLSDWRE